MKENQNNIHENGEECKPEPQKKPYPGLIAIKIDMSNEAIMKAEFPGGIPADCVPMPVPVRKKERPSHLRLVKPGGRRINCD